MSDPAIRMLISLQRVQEMMKQRSPSALGWCCHSVARATGVDASELFVLALEKSNACAQARVELAQHADDEDERA